MVKYATFKTEAIKMVPIHAEDAPTDSVYIDKDNANALTTKSTGGSNTQVGSASTTTDLMVKNKKNGTLTPIQPYIGIALLPDGTICPANSGDPASTVVIGVSLDLIAPDAFGRVLLNGSNAQGVVTGLGYLPGDSVYLSPTPGALTNDPSVFDTDTDAVIRIGVADCATDEAAAEATDLIMMFEVQSKP